MRLAAATLIVAAVFLGALCGFVLTAAGGTAPAGGRPARAGKTVSTAESAPRADSAPAVSAERRAMLSAGGIGTVKFGTDTAAARRSVSRLLGMRPQVRYRANSACNFDHEARFGDLWLYFRHDRFVGYMYGAFGSHPQLRPLMTTTRGLAVGQRLTRARRLYGKDVSWSAAQGGSWSVKTPSGKLIGYANSFPPRGLRSTIATIAAGAVGCPAMTP